jgi:predicted  nucleic acid-binding Zn-ribbon protein
MPRQKPHTCHRCGASYTTARCPACTPKRLKKHHRRARAPYRRVSRRVQLSRLQDILSRSANPLIEIEEELNARGRTAAPDHDPAADDQP